MMKKEKKEDPIIFEDVVWYRKDENGNYSSIADKTFYYQFLMEHADDSINGQANRKAATDFACYQRLYVMLLNHEILNWPSFCMDWTEIEGGATFTFNMTEAMKVFDMEQVMKKQFPQAVMDKYIQSLIHPADGFKCSICGAYSFSRHISFGSGKNKTTYCLACHPIKEELQNEIKRVYNSSGTMAAVKKRLEIIEEAFKAPIAPNKSIDVLLDEFRKDNEIPNEDSVRIQKLLLEKKFDKWECFGAGDVGLVLWDRERLSDINIFSECVAMSEDGEAILAIFDKAGVIYTDEKALEFAKLLEEAK